MKKPHQKLIRAAGSSLKQSKLWTSINGAKGAKASSADVAPTQLDNEDEEMPLPDPSDTVDAEMTNENKGTSEEVRTAKASPSKKKPHVISQSDDRSQENFQGFNFCDAGGSGDCAYRALAVAFALQDKRDPQEAVNASKQLELR